MNRILKNACLALTLLGAAGSVIAADISQESGWGRTRAEACQVAMQKAATGKVAFLEQVGQLASVQKKCDCDHDNNGWACMASIAYTEKK